MLHVNGCIFTCTYQLLGLAAQARSHALQPVNLAAGQWQVVP